MAGCDRLTISPDLLAELSQATGDVPHALDDDGKREAPPAALDEAAFREQHDADPMAKEKLIEGIDKFAADQVKLEAMLRERIG